MVYDLKKITGKIISLLKKLIFAAGIFFNPRDLHPGL